MHVRRAHLCTLRLLRHARSTRRSMPSPPICCSRTKATDSMMISDLHPSKAFGAAEREGRWQEVAMGGHGGASGNASAKALSLDVRPCSVVFGGPHSCARPKQVEEQVAHSPATVDERSATTSGQRLQVQERCLGRPLAASQPCRQHLARSRLERRGLPACLEPPVFSPVFKGELFSVKEGVVE